MNLHVGIPVSFDLLEQGYLSFKGNTPKVEFVEMYGKIRFIDLPPTVGRFYGVFIMVITAMLLYIFLIFRRFINKVNQGIFFDIYNISLLKQIAYTLVAIWIFTAFYAYFQYFYIAINLEFSSLSSPGSVQTYPVILLVALFIWVLSHIFSKGCELQEESNQTV